MIEQAISLGGTEAKQGDTAALQLYNAILQRQFNCLKKQK